jgi:uncharacterized membrane protein YphA (DoxX/SURF4 family)
MFCNQQFDAFIYEWVWFLVLVNIWMWCFPNPSGIHVTKSYRSAPLPTVLTVHHLCCTFIRILICPIINRYFELPKTLLISYKSDWGNLFWTYFGFCFLIGLFPRLHYHIYLCIFIFTWPSLVKGSDYWLINTICQSFFFHLSNFFEWRIKCYLQTDCSWSNFVSYHNNQCMTIHLHWINYYNVLESQVTIDFFPLLSVLHSTKDVFLYERQWVTIPVPYA